MRTTLPLLLTVMCFIAETAMCNDSFVCSQGSNYEVITEPLRARYPSGIVIYGEGEVLSGALVELIDTNEKPTKATKSDDNGKFEFHGVKHGTYKLRISKPQFVTTLVTFVLSRDAKDERVTVRLHFAT